MKKRLRYTTGEDIHVGDHVKHAGRPAVVVAVISSGEFSADFSKAGWSHYKKGFIVRDDDGQVFMYDRPNEDLEFVNHAIRDG